MIMFIGKLRSQCLCTPIDQFLMSPRQLTADVTESIKVSLELFAIFYLPFGKTTFLLVEQTG